MNKKQMVYVLFIEIDKIAGIYSSFAAAKKRANDLGYRSFSVDTYEVID